MADIKQTGWATSVRSDPNGTSGVDTNTSTALATIGTIIIQRDATYGEKAYMYVKASGAVSAGASVVMTGSPYVVAASTAAAKAGVQKVIGVAPVALTTAYYGWIQIRGHSTKILAAPGLCTSACTWTLYSSGGVFSINKTSGVQKCGCSTRVPAGIFTYTKVAAGKSTSGFIASW